MSPLCYFAFKLIKPSGFCEAEVEAYMRGEAGKRMRSRMQNWTSPSGGITLGAVNCAWFGNSCVWDRASTSSAVNFCTWSLLTWQSHFWGIAFSTSWRNNACWDHIKVCMIPGDLRSDGELRLSAPFSNSEEVRPVAASEEPHSLLRCLFRRHGWAHGSCSENQPSVGKWIRHLQ